MVIDKNGTISIQNLRMIITPEFTVDELTHNIHFENFEFNGANNGYIRYILKDLIIDGLPFAALLIFFENKISQIRIMWTSLQGKTREEWKAIEELRKQKHEELLLEQHGATRKKYPWGLIGSIKDIHDGAEYILIKYNNPPSENWREFLKGAS
jgi:hypothetical protein